jgi:CBS domain-containing protein
MNISQICQRDVDTAQPNELVSAAAQRMAARCVGTLVVVDQARRPIGILTDRDIALRVVGDERVAAMTTVLDVMTQKPRTVPESATVEEALASMRSRAVRRLAVVGSGGELAGIVALDDIFALLANEFRQVGGLLKKLSPNELVRH